MATNRYRVPEDQRRVKITVTIPRYLRDLLSECANQSRIVEQALIDELCPPKVKSIKRE